MNKTDISNVRFVEALGKLSVADHPCLIYESLSEKVAVVASFITIGFERDERCLILTPGTKIESFLDELASAGIDTTDALARGTLYLPDIHSIYSRDKPFDGDQVFDFLNQAIKEAKADGHSGLRLIGDMPWTLKGTSGTEPLIEYEARLNDFICSHSLPALCMYDRNIFAPEVLLDVLRTHPKVINGHAITKSYSYLPPHEFFNPERSEIELNKLLRMIPNGELISALTARLDLLDSVFKNSPDFIYVKDLEGHYLMINPAGASLFGKSVEEMLGKTAYEFLSPENAAEISDTDRRAFASDQPLSTESTYTISGVNRTFFIIKGVYRDAKGEVAGLFGISRDITERKRTEQEILAYQERLRFLATELSSVEEHERHKIATALHDQIGQSLALANIKLGALMSMEQGFGLQKEINKIRELLEDAIQQTRSMSMELSPPGLYEFGLETAVQSLCDEFQREYGIKIGLMYDEAIKSIDDDLRALLFKGVRELLVNIIKHARANSADISIVRDGGYIRIAVVDNGVGFDCKNRNTGSGKEGGFGLFSLRERLRYYGGSFDVTSNPGQGTRVTMMAPLIVEEKENPE